MLSLEAEQEICSMKKLWILNMMVHQQIPHFSFGLPGQGMTLITPLQKKLRDSSIKLAMTFFAKGRLGLLFFQEGINELPTASREVSVVLPAKAGVYVLDSCFRGNDI